MVWVRRFRVKPGMTYLTSYLGRSLTRRGGSLGRTPPPERKIKKLEFWSYRNKYPLVYSNRKLNTLGRIRQISIGKYKIYGIYL